MQERVVFKNKGLSNNIINKPAYIGRSNHGNNAFKQYELMRQSGNMDRLSHSIDAWSASNGAH